MNVLLGVVFIVASIDDRLPGPWWAHLLLCLFGLAALVARDSDPTDGGI